MGARSRPGTGPSMRTVLRDGAARAASRPVRPIRSAAASRTRATPASRAIRVSLATRASRARPDTRGRDILARPASAVPVARRIPARTPATAPSSSPLRSLAPVASRPAVSPDSRASPIPPGTRWRQATSRSRRPLHRVPRLAAGRRPRRPPRSWRTRQVRERRRLRVRHPRRRPRRFIVPVAPHVGPPRRVVARQRRTRPGQRPGPWRRRRRLAHPRARQACGVARSPSAPRLNQHPITPPPALPPPALP